MFHDLLWIRSGMEPYLPYLWGQKHFILHNELNMSLHSTWKCFIWQEMACSSLWQPLVMFKSNWMVMVIMRLATSIYEIFCIHWLNSITVGWNLVKQFFRQIGLSPLRSTGFIHVKPFLIIYLKLLYIVDSFWWHAWHPYEYLNMTKLFKNMTGVLRLIIWFCSILWS